MKRFSLQRSVGLSVLMGVVVALFLSAAAAQAANVYWTGAGGNQAWENPNNWEDAVGSAIPGVPESGDRGFLNLDGSNAIWSASTPSTGNDAVDANKGTLHQTGGTFNGIIRIAGGQQTGRYHMVAGTATVSSISIAWGNTGGAQRGYYDQEGGTVTASGTMAMTGQGSNSKSWATVSDGNLSANKITMNVGANGSNKESHFTQTGGTVTFTTGLELGQVGGSAVSTATYTLNGGELTIDGADPLIFNLQDGTAYIDIGENGVMNLKGSWTFAALTGLDNSEFRVLGAAAAPGDLAFVEFAIGPDTYTKISIPPPTGTLFFFR